MTKSGENASEAEVYYGLEVITFKNKYNERTRSFGNKNCKVQTRLTQGRRQRGDQWCPAPPFEIGAPHFTFGPPVAAYIHYCILKMCPPSGFWPLLVFGPPAAKSRRRAWTYLLFLGGLAAVA